MFLIGVLIICFFIAFFPAYLGYTPQLARIGRSITILFALSTFIPFLRTHKVQGRRALIGLSLFGYGIESLGVLSCFPYGCFSYSEQLGPKFLGIVPYLLFATWPPLVIGVRSWLRSQTSIQRGILSWVYGGLILVAVDLILDPIAIRMGLRSFEQTGRRFGIPRTNFAGRLLSGTLGIAILEYFLKKQLVTDTYLNGLFLFISFFVSRAVRSRLIGTFVSI